MARKSGMKLMIESDDVANYLFQIQEIESIGNKSIIVNGKWRVDISERDGRTAYDLMLELFSTGSASITNADVRKISKS